MGNKFEQQVRKQLELLCKKQVFEEKEIVLFGCVQYAKVLREVLAKYNYSFSAIIDNSENTVGHKCMNILVYSPEDYFTSIRNNVIILICSEHWFEMLKQLENLGYQYRKHIYVIGEDIFKLEDDSTLSFIKDMYSVQKGYRIYKKLQKKFTRDTYIFICPYKGTGDVYMAGRYFQEFLDRESIEKYMFLVLNKACYKVASLFQVENIEIISEQDKEFLMSAYNFMGPQNMQMKPLLFWGWRNKKGVVQRKCLNINFDDMFRYDVYDMDRKCNVSNPIFGDAEAYIDHLYQDYNFRKGKTVIFAPYAGSFISDIPNKFWERLAEKLKDRGYIVLTNSAGENEPAIKGTRPIFFDILYAVPVLEAAGNFIGFRSGLCDIISSAKCKKVILYEAGFAASSYECFSLEKMGLADEVIEIIYKWEAEDEFLNSVLKLFQ